MTLILEYNVKYASFVFKVFSEVSDFFKPGRKPVLASNWRHSCYKWGGREIALRESGGQRTTHPAGIL